MFKGRQKRFFWSVSNKFSGCSMEVPKVFHGSLKGVSWISPGCFKVILKRFKRCDKEISRLGGVSRKFQQCFKVIARNVNEDTKVFQDDFKGLSGALI